MSFNSDTKERYPDIQPRKDPNRPHHILLSEGPPTLTILRTIVGCWLCDTSGNFIIPYLGDIWRETNNLDLPESSRCTPPGRPCEHGISVPPQSGWCRRACRHSSAGSVLPGHCHCEIPSGRASGLSAFLEYYDREQSSQPASSTGPGCPLWLTPSTPLGAPAYYWSGILDSLLSFSPPCSCSPFLEFSSLTPSRFFFLSYLCFSLSESCLGMSTCVCVLTHVCGPVSLCF